MPSFTPCRHRASISGWKTPTCPPTGWLRGFTTPTAAPSFATWPRRRGGLFVPVPTGRKPNPMEMAELQQVLAETTGALLRFYAGQADADATLGAVQQAMEALAWHRGNVEKHSQPELEF